MANSFFTKDQQEFLLAWIRNRDRWWRENQLRSLSKKFSKKFGIHFVHFKKEARKFFDSIEKQKKDLESITKHREWLDSIVKR